MAPVFVSYVMVHYGWRSSFWICAVIGLLAGIVWYLIARDKPEGHPFVNSAEISFIQKDRAATALLGSSTKISAPKDEAGSSVTFPGGAFLTSKSILAVTASYFCFGYVAWIFFSWFYIYLAKCAGWI